MKKILLLLSLFLFFFCSFQNVSAEETPAPTVEKEKKIKLLRREEVDDTFGIQFGYFKQDDGQNGFGGNIFIDEYETVYEAIIFLDKKLGEKDSLRVHFLGDLISSASISRYNYPQFRALQANPSGNKRAEFGAGWQHEFDGFSAGINGSISAEFSRYYSGGYGANFSIPLNDDNTILSLRYQGYYDYFQIKLWTGFEPGYDKRLTNTGEFNITQVLTPTTLLNFDYSFTYQNGYLATTYNSVFVNTVEAIEVMPHNRIRNAFTTRLKQSLTEWNSIEGGYRFYIDSWGIWSHTLDTRFAQYVWEKNILLEPGYRFYNQDKADFHQIAFTQNLPHMTSDADLSHFNSHSIGISGTWIRPTFLPGQSDIDVSFYYTIRSSNLDSYWTTVGYKLYF